MSRPAPVSVCVFCASSEDVADPLRRLAAGLGQALATRGWRLVYGGGGIGLMGEVARAAMRSGGEVLGVIPEHLTGREAVAPEITELHVVDGLRERKRRMDEASDAFVVLPGGIGTAEELLEVVTLRHLGRHDRPVVLLDPDGFWAPLHDLFGRMVAARLAPPSLPGQLSTAVDVTTALTTIDAALGR